MHVAHTAADPPNQGRMCFEISGCTKKSRKALEKMVPAKRNFILAFMGRLLQFLLSIFVCLWNGTVKNVDAPTTPSDW